MRNIARTWYLCLLTGLTFALTVAYLMLLFSSSATSQGGREVPGARFEFALIGDMPYDARQEKEFANLMTELDATELAFVVHDGDVWYDGGGWDEHDWGIPPFGGQTIYHRPGHAYNSEHPFRFSTAGNEW